MNATVTAFARPPKRRRCGYSSGAVRRIRAESGRAPNRIATNANDGPQGILTRIDFATAPSSANRFRRDPNRSLRRDPERPLKRGIA
jgi:cellulase/cellobiase CelA1